MADEPKNPQQIIDDATNALGQAVVKPPKKKGRKGMLIGILLFLILTLPVAIYYGTQQITDIRSRAAGRCEQKSTAGLCADIECMAYVGQTSCTSGTGTCCRWVTVTPPPTPTPTAPPPTYTCISSDYTCVSSRLECRDGGGKEVSKTCANAAWSCCDFSTATTPCQRCSNTNGCTYATWINHGASCEPVNSVGSISRETNCDCKPVSGGDNSACSSCAAATPTCPPYDPRLSPNCGCGEAFCGGCISACRHITDKTCQQLIDEECNVTPTTQPPSGQKMYYCRTDNYSCIQTTDSYTNESACTTNVQLYGQKPNTGACYSSLTSCQSACQVAGSFMYVCNTSTYQCTQTSSRYTSITACEGGSD